MAHSRRQHPNAALTPVARRKMVACVLERGWSTAAAADRFQVDAKTVRKWCSRFAAEGSGGLMDRSSRPHRSPNRTPERLRREVIELRRRRRWGADHIAAEVDLAASTVQAILNREGLGRLDRGDRARRDPPRRYVRDRPGELVHLDVKKLPAIPAGGGWRMHGRGNAPPTRRSTVGWRYIHTAIDDRTRIAYSEACTDEKGATAAAFWQRAAAWFAQLGFACERALTDNGACYRSDAFKAALAATATTHKTTRPYRPQTNGKVERFHRILIEEWAYIRDWHNDTQRQAALDGFIHFYNHHRSHGALNWNTPAATLNHLLKDNLPAEHN